LEQLVTIELFGQTYSFRAETEVSQAQEVADLLVAEVNRVEQQHDGKLPRINSLAILISAALNIANNHYELKRRYAELLEGVSQRSERLMSMLETNVP
jgi:cell division protein ZapA (FtsZ GTPase activity inhibitor)